MVFKVDHKPSGVGDQVPRTRLRIAENRRTRFRVTENLVLELAYYGEPSLRRSIDTLTALAILAEAALWVSRCTDSSAFLTTTMRLRMSIVVLGTQ